MSSQPHARDAGVKVDAGKPPAHRGLLAFFPHALLEVAKASQAGANKYAWGNWRTLPDGINRFSDALVRHLIGEQFEEMDEEMQLPHAVLVAWNALVRLELILGEKGSL